MNKTQLISRIEQYINGNNQGAITGPILQQILKDIVDYASEAGDGAQGKDGRGVAELVSTDVEGTNGNTGKKIKFKLTDNSFTQSFTIWDGEDGAAGPQGAKGRDGRDGVNGSNGSDGRDGRDGADGRDGKDGKDGEDGFQGRQGAAVRGPYDYYSMSSTTRWWCSGEESEENPDNALWIDIILKDDVYYYCSEGYYGKLAPWNTMKSHWTAGDSFEFIATKLLLARNAKINFLTGNEIYLMDSNGEITGGAAGGQGVSFWAGAENPSSGKFRVYADGRLVATNAQIKGAITATSLTLRGSSIDDYIHNEIDDAMADFDPSQGIDEDAVNDLIAEYLRDLDYVKPSDLNGFFDENRLREWFRNNYSGWTEEEIEEIVRRIATAETSSVEEIPLDEYRKKYIAYIGDRAYEWITVDGGDYLILGAVFSGVSGNEITRFVVDKNGLLQANNAIIYGKIYASEGYFHGSVSATDGYFKGDVTANSLTLGNESIQDYIGARVSAATGSEGITSEDVRRMISGAAEDYGWVIEDDLGDYLVLGETIGSGTSSVTISKNGLLIAKNAVISGTVYATDGKFKGAVTANSGTFTGTIHAKNGDFKGSVSATDGYFKGSISADSGYFHGDIVANSLMLGSESIQDYISGQLPDGGVTTGDVQNIVDAALSGKSWVVEEQLDGYLKIGVRVGDSTSSVTISSAGILTAKNAIISGSVFATDGYFNGEIHANSGDFYGNVSANSGYFKGSVSADNGYFHGDIVANSLMLGSESIQDYISGQIPEGGVTTGDVQNIVDSALSGKSWVVEEQLNGYLKLGVRVGDTTSSVTITSAGLLTAKNAVISGSVFATDGYFNGEVHANSGDFYGNISANSGYFKGSVSADSGYFNGTIHATDGVFMGTVSAATIEASDVKLGGKSITFGDNSSGLVISNEAITIDYVPKTYTRPQGTIGIQTTGMTATWPNNGETYSSDLEFEVTGTTGTVDINVKELVLSGEFGGLSSNGGSYGTGDTLYYTATTEVLRGGTVIASTPKTGNASIQIAPYTGSPVTTSMALSITIPRFSFTATTGYYYTMRTKLKVSGMQQHSNAQVNLTVPETQITIPAVTPPDKQQVKIGSNGIQILLGGNGTTAATSFYLTAANDPSHGGPVIAFGGRINGNMKTIKIDSTGLVIDD